jgi:soluble lytic murein transglycosylase-like protein
VHKKILLVAIAALSVQSARAESFSASDVPQVRLKGQGKIVIRNDARSITASRFFGNIEEALVTLRSSRRIAAQPFGSAVYQSDAPVQTIVPEYLSTMITEAGRTHGVDPRLIAAVAKRESAFNPNAISPVGACGVMQLMPATGKFLGVSNLFDARQNIFAGARYLRTLLDTFGGDLDLTLAAYNAGPGAVQKYNGVPPFRETRGYVAAIRSSYERALRAQ